MVACCAEGVSYIPGLYPFSWGPRIGSAAVGEELYAKKGSYPRKDDWDIS